MAIVFYSIIVTLHVGFNNEITCITGYMTFFIFNRRLVLKLEMFVIKAISLVKLQNKKNLLYLEHLAIMECVTKQNYLY